MRKRKKQRKIWAFLIAISIKDWRIVYDMILMKFQYVVYDNEIYVLTGVDRWFCFPIVWLSIPIW